MKGRQEEGNGRTSAGERGREEVDKSTMCTGTMHSPPHGDITLAQLRLRREKANILLANTYVN